MMFSTPAHKQTDPTKQPGQIVNPIPDNHDMMDDMGAIGDAKVYKPSHGGYSGTVKPGNVGHVRRVA